MENKKYWYAVCVGENDDDLGMGSFDYKEARMIALSIICCESSGGVIIKTVDDADAFVLEEEIIDFHGVKWGDLEDFEREMLLKSAIAVSGETGNQIFDDGECIIDLSAYPFSVSGEMVDGKLVIDDDAYIYNVEKGIIL